MWHVIVVYDYVYFLDSVLFFAYANKVICGISIKVNMCGIVKSAGAKQEAGYIVSLHVRMERFFFSDKVFALSGFAQSTQ